MEHALHGFDVDVGKLADRLRELADEIEEMEDSSVSLQGVKDTLNLPKPDEQAQVELTLKYRTNDEKFLNNLEFVEDKG